MLLVEKEHVDDHESVGLIDHFQHTVEDDLLRPLDTVLLVGDVGQELESCDTAVGARRRHPPGEWHPHAPGHHDDPPHTHYDQSGAQPHAVPG